MKDIGPNKLRCSLSKKDILSDGANIIAGAILVEKTSFQ